MLIRGALINYHSPLINYFRRQDIEQYAGLRLFRSPSMFCYVGLSVELLCMGCRNWARNHAAAVLYGYLL